MDTLRELLGANAAEPAGVRLRRRDDRPRVVRHGRRPRIEDLAVDAFNGQVANLTPRARAESARVVSVNARHAAWVRAVQGREPAPEAVEPGRPAAEVARALDATGIVQGGTP